MATKLEDLMAQKAAIEKEIERERERAIEYVIEEVNDVLRRIGMPMEEFINEVQKRTNKRYQSVPPKYRDPDTGKTWSGRGRTPKFLEGKNLDDYLIKE